MEILYSVVVVELSAARRLRKESSGNRMRGHDYPPQGGLEIVIHRKVTPVFCYPPQGGLEKLVDDGRSRHFVIRRKAA